MQSIIVCSRSPEGVEGVLAGVEAGRDHGDHAGAALVPDERVAEHLPWVHNITIFIHGSVGNNSLNSGLSTDSKCMRDLCVSTVLRDFSRVRLATWGVNPQD